MYVDSYAKICLILYPPFENSTTRIAMISDTLIVNSWHISDYCLSLTQHSQLTIWGEWVSQIHRKIWLMGWFRNNSSMLMLWISGDLVRKRYSAFKSLMIRTKKLGIHRTRVHWIEHKTQKHCFVYCFINIINLHKRM